MDKWIENFDIEDFIKYDLIDTMKTFMRFNYKEIFDTISQAIDSLGENPSSIEELKPVAFSYCTDEYRGIHVYKHIIKSIEELNNQKLINMLESLLDEFCEEYSLCRQCGEELETLYYEDSREFWGAPCVEVFSQVICPNGCCQ